MPVIEVVNDDRRNPASIYLLDSSKNIFSQAGEDGILQKVFEIIGTTNSWCVEFGAWDGIVLSNTCHLIKDKGWTGVQIEGDAAKFQVLKDNFEGFDKVIQVRRIVGFTRGEDTIDDILSDTTIPRDFDLISIDVDGIDWHVWASIENYRPRVVVIEFNPTVPNDVVFIQDRDVAVNEGCSLLALVRLSKEKGYELVCATRMNAIFVVKEEFHKFGIADNSVEAMYSDAKGRIFQAFNGTFYHTMERFFWGLKKREAKPDMFQLLSAEERKYGDRIVR